MEDAVTNSLITWEEFGRTTAKIVGTWVIEASEPQ
jgi:hypothetical protein